MVALPRNTLERFIRFALVGGAGFIVDAGLTVGLQAAGLDIFSSRLIAISLAMLVTWRLNRAITFGASPSGQAGEGVRYGVVAVAVAGVNYAAYAALMLFVPGMPAIIAVALATGLSMILSYTGYSRLVFRAA